MQDTPYSRRELAIEEELKKEKRLRESYRRQLEEVEEKERGLEMAKKEKVRQEDAERKKEIREIEKKEKELQEREKRLDEAAERLKMMDTFTTRDNIKVSSSENAQETFKRTSKVSRKRTRIPDICHGRRRPCKFPNRDLAQRRDRGDRESGRFRRQKREPHGQTAPLLGNEERFHRGRDKLDVENQKRKEERLRKRLREKEEIIKQQEKMESGLNRKDEQSKKTWEI